MGAVSILGFGALEGFGWCWVMGFLRVLLGSALWASWALPLYTPCVLRGALRFFLMKFLLTYQKKRLFPFLRMLSLEVGKFWIWYL